jgi:hypothetical protein
MSTGMFHTRLHQPQDSAAICAGDLEKRHLLGMYPNTTPPGGCYLVGSRSLRGMFMRLIIVIACAAMAIALAGCSNQSHAGGPTVPQTPSPSVTTGGPAITPEAGPKASSAGPVPTSPKGTTPCALTADDATHVFKALGGATSSSGEINDKGSCDYFSSASTGITTLNLHPRAYSASKQLGDDLWEPNGGIVVSDPKAGSTALCSKIKALSTNSEVKCEVSGGAPVVYQFSPSLGVAIGVVFLPDRFWYISLRALDADESKIAPAMRSSVSALTGRLT